MKKIRFILPLLAFLFAVIGALATDAKNKAVAGTFWRLTGGEPVCVLCDTDPVNPSQCSTSNTGEICKCQDPNVNARIGDATACTIARRPM